MPSTQLGWRARDGVCASAFYFMIPKIDGENLCGRDGLSIGHIRNGILVIRTTGFEELKVCAHAILEFGDQFNWVWVNDMQTGRIASIPVPELRKLGCDNDNRHIITPKHLQVIETEDDYRHQLSGAR